MAENSEKIDSCGDSSEQCHCYSALVGEQSIVMSMSVCLSVCLISQEPHAETSPNFLWTLTAAVAQFCSASSVMY